MTMPFRVRRDHPHLVLIPGGRSHLPATFVVAPPALQLAMTRAAVPASNSRVVRMQEADLLRCRSLRPVAY